MAARGERDGGSGHGVQKRFPESSWGADDLGVTPGGRTMGERVEDYLNYYTMEDWAERHKKKHQRTGDSLITVDHNLWPYPLGRSKLEIEKKKGSKTRGGLAKAFLCGDFICLRRNRKKGRTGKRNKSAPGVRRTSKGRTRNLQTEGRPG